MKKASALLLFVFCGTALVAQHPPPTTPGPDNRDQFILTLYEALKTGQGR